MVRNIPELNCYPMISSFLYEENIFVVRGGRGRCWTAVGLLFVGTAGPHLSISFLCGEADHEHERGRTSSCFAFHHVHIFFGPGAYESGGFKDPAQKRPRPVDRQPAGADPRPAAQTHRTVLLPRARVGVRPGYKHVRKAGHACEALHHVHDQRRWTTATPPASPVV